MHAGDRPGGVHSQSTRDSAHGATGRRHGFAGSRDYLRAYRVLTGLDTVSRLSRSSARSFKDFSKSARPIF